MKFLVFALLLIFSNTAPAEDLIGTLPFYPYNSIGGNANQYSGYLNVGKDKHFHYIFSESQGSQSDPLVLWLTGGPGCSGLLAWSQEHGPAVFQEGTANFNLNQYSWNTNAHIIYLESPAGVGFSYTTGKLYNTDQTTAEDNLQSLLAFFEKYPEYKENDFIIAGESYGGIYVPELAEKVLEYNKNSEFKINLKGISVGNGYTDPVVENSENYYNYLWEHTLVSPNLRSDYLNYCINTKTKNKQKCDYTTKYIDWITEWINPYDIYRKCYRFQKPGPAPEEPKTSTLLPDNRNFEVDFPYSQRQFTGTKGKNNNSGIPCLDVYGPQHYFNRKDVQEVLHVKQTKWFECSNVNYHAGNKGSFHIYPKLLEAGIRVLFYSGDTDSVVNIDGTRKWIEKLNLEVEQPWTYWTLDGIDVLGYVTYYKNFTFVTVKGVGHIVPQWAPKEAYHIFNSWLNNTPIN